MHRSSRTGRILLALAACGLSLSCHARDERSAHAPPKGRAAAPLRQAHSPEAALPRTAAEPVARTAKPAGPPSAAIQLDKAVERLGRGFDGSVGIAVRDIQTGWTSDHRGLDYFPQQSVSKLWVSLAALDQVDARRLDLARPVTVTEQDLTLFHQPIRTLALRPAAIARPPPTS